MENLDFEQGMEELEAIVQALEKGNLKLEASFDAYERGAKLAARLEKLLAQGEARIAALEKAAEGFSETDISGEVAP